MHARCMRDSLTLTHLLNSTYFTYTYFLILTELTSSLVSISSDLRFAASARCRSAIALSISVSIIEMRRSEPSFSLGEGGGEGGGER